MKFLTVSVVLSFFVCVVFTVVVIVCNCLAIEISDTLIQWFFTVFGVEFAAAAAIKISKHTIERQKIKERVQMIKDEGLEVEKSDLSESPDNEMYYDTGEYVDMGGEEYYG